MYRRELLKALGTIPFVPLLNVETTARPFPGRKNIDPGKQGYHLVIYGATPGGIACALRAAREGLKVLLVNHTQHLGGMFVNGLGTMDTLYNGARAPIYDELRYNIYDYYRNTYGTNSPQYKATNPGFPKTRFESSAVEHLVNEMLGRESLITIEKGYYPARAGKAGNLLTSIVFQRMEGEETFTAEGDIFADCSYEGDLAAIAGAATRIGRESKEEYGEKYAGVTYTEKNSWPPPSGIDHESFRLVRRMNLFRYDSWSELMMPESTGVAHAAVQAFNIRTTLTDDPENRILPQKPENYDPEYLRETFGEIEEGAGLSVPNRKTSWNQPELIGEQNKYVEGDWVIRKRVTAKFREITLGLLYFKQNDPSVPEEERSKWKEYGLPKDEYPDNGNMPYEVYVREARRLVGKAIFTQHDGQLAEGLERAPVHADSISVTEWFMDSHACTSKTVKGSKPEGEVMLKNMTFPGQIAFNTLFSHDIDNLMVPVCLSASHIGWGTIRLEPTWMSIGEAAAYAASVAVRQQVPPAKIASDKLVRLLARKRIMITFFNDMEGRESAPWYPSVQYLGTRGFFGSYDAFPHQMLSNPLAEAWIRLSARLVKGLPSDLTSLAGEVLIAEKKGGEPVTAKEFASRLGGTLLSGANSSKMQEMLNKLAISPGTFITRGDACRLIFESTSL